MTRKSRKDAAALAASKKATMKIWRAALYIRLSVEFNLLVNEDTAPIVRQIFQWALDGVALNVIVKQLNEGGVGENSGGSGLHRRYGAGQAHQHRS